MRKFWPSSRLGLTSKRRRRLRLAWRGSSSATVTSAKTRRAFSSTWRRARRSATPRRSATNSAVWLTLAGSLGLPRTGTGVEVGGVGLHQQQLGGQRRGRPPAGRCVLGVGHVARERAQVAALHGLVEPVGGARSSAGSR